MPEGEAENKRALVVSAHPDDSEFGSAGTAHLWTSQGWQFYYLIWALTFATLLLARNITSHRTGRALRAILGSEVAAAALGVEVPRYKMQVFVASAAYAALAGAVYAHYIRFISPSPFALYASLFFLIMAVVGGLTNIWGGLFGATVEIGRASCRERG